MIGFTKFLGMTVLKDFYVMVGIDANIVCHTPTWMHVCAHMRACTHTHTHTHTFFGREGSIEPLDDLSTFTFKKSAWDEMYFGNCLWKTHPATIPYHCVKLKL